LLKDFVAIYNNLSIGFAKNANFCPCRFHVSLKFAKKPMCRLFGAVTRFERPGWRSNFTSEISHNKLKNIKP
jgi:hypothetical protein